MGGSVSEWVGGWVGGWVGVRVHPFHFYKNDPKSSSK